MFRHSSGIEHIGLVSDRVGRSGRPLIINAWTTGYVTSEMDLLGGVAAPAAYRVPAARPGPVGSSNAVVTESAARLPAGAAFRLDPSIRQAVVALSPSWSSAAATVSWWGRERGGAWVRQGRATPAMLGEHGMGWGLGLLPASVTNALSGPTKSEGDGRAPAGLFRLTRATGYSTVAPSGLRLPYQSATTNLRCVDDPRSCRHRLGPAERRGVDATTAGAVRIEAAGLHESPGQGGRPAAASPAMVAAIRPAARGASSRIPTSRLSSNDARVKLTEPT